MNRRGFLGVLGGAPFGIKKAAQAVSETVNSGQFFPGGLKYGNSASVECYPITDEERMADYKARLKAAFSDEEKRERRQRAEREVMGVGIHPKTSAIKSLSDKRMFDVEVERVIKRLENDDTHWITAGIKSLLGET